MSCGKESGETDEIYDCNFEDTLDGSKKIEAPKVRMMFGSKDEVHQYYASYAQQEGFEVMIRSSRKGDNGSIKYFTLVCACTGKTETNEQVQRYDKLCSYFYEIAAESEEKCNHLMSYLSEIKEKMQKTDDQLIKSQCPSLSPCNEEFNEMSKPCTKVLSPLPVRAKGCSPSKRKESKIHQLVRKKKCVPNLFWSGCYNGVAANIPNLIGNHPQPYPIHYMVMRNQLAPPISHLHALQVEFFKSYIQVAMEGEQF
ncbi:hypothetical protein ACSBR2_013131 [Camellia fascicularis]